MSLENFMSLKNLMALLILLNTADALITYYAVTNGLATEMNPLYNPYAVPVLKLVAPFILFVCWLLFNHRYGNVENFSVKIAKRFLKCALYSLVFLYLGVIVNNIVVLALAFA